MLLLQTLILMQQHSQDIMSRSQVASGEVHCGTDLLHITILFLALQKKFVRLTGGTFLKISAS
jgi:hypothetical protein